MIDAKKKALIKVKACLSSCRITYSISYKFIITSLREFPIVYNRNEMLEQMTKWKEDLTTFIQKTCMTRKERKVVVS